MALILDYRASHSASRCYYSAGSPFVVLGRNTSSIATPARAVNANATGGYAIDMTAAGYTGQFLEIPLIDDGLNWTNLTFLIRMIVPTANIDGSGYPNTDPYFLNFCDDALSFENVQFGIHNSRPKWLITADGTFLGSDTNGDGSFSVWTGDTEHIVAGTYNGTTGALTFSFDGTLVCTNSVTGGFGGLTKEAFRRIVVGDPSGGVSYQTGFHLVQLKLWDSIETITWVSNPDLDGDDVYSESDPYLYTSIPANQVNDAYGAYTVAGASRTPTLALPSASQVLSGVNYGPDSGTAGTYEAAQDTIKESTVIATAPTGTKIIRGAT